MSSAASQVWGNCCWNSIFRVQDIRDTMQLYAGLWASHFQIACAMGLVQHWDSWVECPCRGDLGNEIASRSWLCSLAHNFTLMWGRLKSELLFLTVTESVCFRWTGGVWVRLSYITVPWTSHPDQSCSSKPESGDVTHAHQQRQQSFAEIRCSG